MVRHRHLYLILITIIAAVMFLTGCSEMMFSFDSLSESTPPSIDDCQYKIVTRTCIIYTDSCEDDGEVVLIHGYFENIGDSWAWRDSDLSLDRELFGKVEVIERGSEQDREPYWLFAMVGPSRIEELRTVGHWTGEGPKRIKFKATKAPWVINGGYKPTSKITSTFSISVAKEPAVFYQWALTTRSGIESIIMEDTGDFIIKIESTGCQWWVKVGIE